RPRRTRRSRSAWSRLLSDRPQGVHLGLYWRTVLVPPRSLLRALLILLAFATACLLPSVALAQTWWDAGWGHRVELPLQNGGASTDVSDLPLLVRLDSDRIGYADTEAGGTDLRFVIDDGGSFTLLSHEIERWDPAGTSLVWVHLPLFDV